MGRLRNLRIALVTAGVLASAVMASAQITTGSVTGSVRDGQGAVIPGATVALVSETRGTQAAGRVHQARKGTSRSSTCRPIATRSRSA